MVLEQQLRSYRYKMCNFQLFPEPSFARAPCLPAQIVGTTRTSAMVTRPAALVAALLAGIVPSACPLDNGLALTPPMGWSSWYAAPGGSQVTSAFMRNQTAAIVARGLMAKGYLYSNVDEGWLKGRFANGTIYEDFEKVRRVRRGTDRGGQ
jgi:hypothetical protein